MGIDAADRHAVRLLSPTEAEARRAQNAMQTDLGKEEYARQQAYRQSDEH
jgi:hypothetical protein